MALLIGIPLILSTLSSRQYGIMYSTVLAFLTYYAFMVVSIVAYRLSPLHPLARHQGPIVAKISAFWMAWIASRGKRHVYIERLHKQYGDVVRIG